MRQISFTRSIIMFLTLLVLLGVSRSGMQAQSISENDVYAVAWSPDGSKIAGGGSNGLMRIWNPSGQVLRDITGFTSGMRTVTWSPDSTKVASGDDTGRIRVWNASTGQLLTTIAAHDDVVQSIAWSPDGSMILSTTFQDAYNIKVWNASTYRQVSFSGAAQLFDGRWSPDGSTIAVGGVDGTLSMFNINLYQMRQYLESLGVPMEPE
jgi:WD40 repeat protein